MVLQREPVSTAGVCIAPQTIAIVFRQHAHIESRRSNSGERLFTHFKRINTECADACDQRLLTSFKRVTFVGFIFPHTLLLHGKNCYILILRKAWMKNMLLAPQGYHIEFLGVLPSLVVNAEYSTGSTSLPAALRLVIQQLNEASQPASVSSIKLELEHYYRRCQLPVPSDQVVFETLNTLLTEKKLCLTADAGYFISTESQLHRISSRFTSHGPHAGPPAVAATARSDQMKERSDKVHCHKNIKKVRIMPLTDVNQNELVTEALQLPAHQNLKNTNHCNPSILKRRVLKDKDKGNTLTRLFRHKPKQTKDIYAKTETSSESSSGCSSASSPLLSEEDESIEFYNLANQRRCHGSRNDVNNPTVPYKATELLLNDSMRVHCGETILNGTAASCRGGSSFTIADRNNTVGSSRKAPPRSIKHLRSRATTHLVERPVTDNRFSDSSTDCFSTSTSTSSEADHCLLPTQTISSSKTEPLSHLTRNSTQLSITEEGSEYFKSPPNVSAIDLLSHTMAEEDLLQSTKLQLTLLSPRVSADGQSDTITDTTVVSESQMTCQVDSCSSLPPVDSRVERGQGLHPTTTHHSSLVSAMATCSERFCNCGSQLDCGGSSVSVERVPHN